MNIYCCECNQEVAARLTDGKEVYPHRPDLHTLPFWMCDACGNFVGCHHKTKNRTRPLGVIANAEIKKARQHIHGILDPLWKSGLFDRKSLYKKLSLQLGYEYHTAEIKSLEEVRKVYNAVIEVRNTLGEELKNASRN